MGNRNFEFTNDEVYHIYNRGVDKRTIFQDQYDSMRFLESMAEFNTVEPIESLFSKSFKNKTSTTSKSKNKNKPLVDIICFCLNPNHFHFLLAQKVEGGISEFMKRLSGGYTWYFNHKHKRNGSLFQGTFKAKHISDNDYLLHMSAYVNLNDRVHQLSGFTAKLVRNSWSQYSKGESTYLDCNDELILGQFKNCDEYKKFALDSLILMKERKMEDKELESLLLEED